MFLFINTNGYLFSGFSSLISCCSKVTSNTTAAISTETELCNVHTKKNSNLKYAINVLSWNLDWGLYGSYFWYHKFCRNLLLASFYSSQIPTSVWFHTDVISQQRGGYVYKFKEIFLFYVNEGNSNFCEYLSSELWCTKLPFHGCLSIQIVSTLAHKGKVKMSQQVLMKSHHSTNNNLEENSHGR